MIKHDKISYPSDIYVPRIPLSKEEKAELILKGHCQECLHKTIGHHATDCSQHWYNMYSVFKMTEVQFKKEYYCKFTQQEGRNIICGS